MKYDVVDSNVSQAWVVSDPGFNDESRTLRQLFAKGHSPLVPNGSLVTAHLCQVGDASWRVTVKENCGLAISFFRPAAVCELTLETVSVFPHWFRAWRPTWSPRSLRRPTGTQAKWDTRRRPYSEQMTGCKRSVLQQRLVVSIFSASLLSLRGHSWRLMTFVPKPGAQKQIMCIYLIFFLRKTRGFWEKLKDFEKKLKNFDKKLKEFCPKLKNPPIPSW